MRSGSSESRYFAVTSCATFSGPPVTRTRLSASGCAWIIFSSNARTAGSSRTPFSSNGIASAARAPRVSAAAVAAERWRKSRRVVVMFSICAGQSAVLQHEREVPARRARTTIPERSVTIAVHPVSCDARIGRGDADDAHPGREARLDARGRVLHARRSVRPPSEPRAPKQVALRSRLSPRDHLAGDQRERQRKSAPPRAGWRRERHGPDEVTTAHSSGASSPSRRAAPRMAVMPSRSRSSSASSHATSSATSRCGATLGDDVARLPAVRQPHHRVLVESVPRAPSAAGRGRWRRASPRARRPCRTARPRWSARARVRPQRGHGIGAGRTAERTPRRLTSCSSWSSSS